METERPRILVVDDEVPFARLVAEVLNEKGYECALAHALTPAADLARHGGYDAAIFDLVLPEGSGLQLVEPFCAHSPDAQVIVLTGRADVEGAIGGIERGVFAFLQKAELDLGRLEQTVAQATARKVLLQERRALVTRLEESNRLMRALQEQSTKLSDEPHLDRLLPQVVDAAKALTDAAAGRVLLFQRGSGGEVLVVESSVGDGALDLRGARLQPGDGLAAQTAALNRPIRLDEPGKDPRYSHRCDDLGGGPGWLGVPLCRHGVLGTLVVAGRPGGFQVEHESVLSSLGRQAALLIDIALEHERSINFFTHVSDLLVQVLERLDIYYPGHSRRVAALADMVSRRLGLEENERRAIHFGALLHDIGKIRIGSEVLTSARPLVEDRAAMQRHPELGYEILRSISAWEDILPVVLYHHERWDGKGYPRGIAGEQIPVGARIVAVAEAFDAMTRDTPHGVRKEEAAGLRELERCAGSQFDPRVVRIFVTEFEKHGHPLGTGA